MLSLLPILKMVANLGYATEVKVPDDTAQYMTGAPCHKHKDCPVTKAIYIGSNTIHL